MHHEPTLTWSEVGLTPRGIARWWSSLDKPLLVSIGALILIGIVLCVAAGPIAAMRKEIANPMYFVERQFIFLVPAVFAIFVGSLLSPLQVRRAGIILAILALGAMLLTPLIGVETKGATRWLSVFGISLQPSEFFKPGFVLLTSWLLAESQRQHRFPGGMISLMVFAIAALVLIVQPDYGQLMLLTAIWGVVFFIAGWSWGWILGLGALTTGIIGFGYRFAPHVRDRIERFISPESGDNYQVERSLDTISGGGLLGHDLNNMPSVKGLLPDAHTDFIFAVAGEEFGFLLCFVIIALFATIILRSLQLAWRSQSAFVRCAVAGLSAQLAFQAIVNIGVTLAILPAKGMTLPFISTGGSSLLASGITAGFLLALTRHKQEG